MVSSPEGDRQQLGDVSADLIFQKNQKWKYSCAKRYRAIFTDELKKAQENCRSAKNEKDRAKY